STPIPSPLLHAVLLGGIGVCGAIPAPVIGMILGPGAPRLRLVQPVIGVILELPLPPKPPAGPLARRRTAIPLIWNSPARLEHAAATSAPPTRHGSAPPQSRAKGQSARPAAVQLVPPASDAVNRLGGSVKTSKAGSFLESAKGQEGQRQEAARPGRYPGSDAACDRHCSRYPGPRRRGYAAGHAIRPLSLPAQALRGWRLSRTRVPRLRASRPGAGGSGDRQTLGSGQRLRRLAETLGGGKNAGLAGPLPPSRQGLGGAQPQGPRLSDDGLHPPHGQKAMPQLRMIPDRL